MHTQVFAAALFMMDTKRKEPSVTAGEWINEAKSYDGILLGSQKSEVLMSFIT